MKRFSKIHIAKIYHECQRNINKVSLQILQTSHCCIKHEERPMVLIHVVMSNVTWTTKPVRWVHFLILRSIHLVKDEYIRFPFQKSYFKNIMSK